VIAFPLSCRGRRSARSRARPRASEREPPRGQHAARRPRAAGAGRSVAPTTRSLLKRARRWSGHRRSDAASTTPAIENLVLRRETKRARAAAGRSRAVPLSRRVQGGQTTRTGHLFGSRASWRRAAVIRRAPVKPTSCRASAATSSPSSCLIPAGRRFAVGERIRERICAHSFWPATASTFTSRVRSASPRCPMCRVAEELVQAADQSDVPGQETGNERYCGRHRSAITDLRSPENTSRFCTTRPRKELSVESSFDAFPVLE